MVGSQNINLKLRNTMHDGQILARGTLDGTKWKKLVRRTSERGRLVVNIRTRNFICENGDCHVIEPSIKHWTLVLRRRGREERYGNYIRRHEVGFGPN